MRVIDISDLDDIAVGAAILGTGGGGDPYVGKLLAAEAIRANGPVTVLDLDSLPDASFVVAAGGMGAPTIVIEKIPGGDELLWALRHYEARFGVSVEALIPFEVGGLNSCLPIMLAAQAHLPLLDADGMGRAFPRLEMETFNVYGVPCSPVVIADERGDLVVIETESAARAESIARGVTIRMGGQSSLVNYGMNGATAKRVSVRGTMSVAQDIGRTIREARATHVSPLDALIGFLATTSYEHARHLGSGKIVDVARRLENGWSVGIVTIEAFGGGGFFSIRFQNENLTVHHDGRLLAVVPDLICILDADTSEAIPTERLRYGQRVAILAVRVPPIMRSPEALAVFGPAAFGIDAAYAPLGLS